MEESLSFGFYTIYIHHYRCLFDIGSGRVYFNASIELAARKTVFKSLPVLESGLNTPYARVHRVYTYMLPCTCQ